MNNLGFEVRSVIAHIDDMKRRFPELSEDIELLASTVEGESDFDRVMEKLVDGFLDAVSMKEAIASRLSDMRERASRFDRRADAYKGLMQRLMAAAGVTKLPLAIATLSIREGSQSVEVIDERMLPQGMFTRVPNKSAIKSAILAGDPIPGAELVRGEPSLSVRSK